MFKEIIYKLFKSKLDYESIIPVVTKKVEEKIAILEGNFQNLDTKTVNILSIDKNHFRMTLWVSMVDKIGKVDNHLITNFITGTSITKGDNIRQKSENVAKGKYSLEDRCKDWFELELSKIRKEAELVKENQITSKNETVLHTIIFVATATLFSQFKINSNEGFYNVYTKILKNKKLEPLINIKDTSDKKKVLEKSLIANEESGFESVVNKQIDIYLKLKKKYSEMTENEILNILLMSRIKIASMLPQFPLKEQELYYEQPLKDRGKGLENIIFHIVWYEYIDSRKDWVDKNASHSEQVAFENLVKEYISNQIKEEVGNN